MNEQMNMPASGSKKWMWAVAATAAVLLALAWWMWQRPKEAAAPDIGGPALSDSDTTAAIEQELQATDLGDLEAELQASEADLQSL